MVADLFTAETPLGTYQGMTDQTVLSRTPGAFRTVLVPRGSSKPMWRSDDFLTIQMADFSFTAILGKRAWVSGSHWGW